MKTSSRVPITGEEQRLTRGDKDFGYLCHPAPRIVSSKMVGYSDFHNEIIALCDELVAAGETPLLIFHDWSGLQGYAAGARQALTDWVKHNRRDIERLHVLFKSPLVAMGVSVASLFLPRMFESYSNPEAFEKVRDEAIARHLSEAGIAPPR